MQTAFESAREKMVFGQILPNKVTAPNLIQALRVVPREQFVPKHLQSIAYVDEDIALGNGRYLPEPMVLARLIQYADIQKTDVVLDIGCGTGYSAAILGQLAATVVGIEQDPNMVKTSDKLLHDLDVCNAVVIRQESLQQGYPQQAPYDVILINGSAAEIPQALKQQLAPNGRLVAVLSDGGHMGSAVMVTRTDEGFVTRKLFDAATPTLAGFETQKGFSFT